MTTFGVIGAGAIGGFYGARANGREIPPEFDDALIEGTRAMTPYATSMKVDFDNSRRLEVEAMIGNPMRGALSFGLVNVPVKVHPATQDNDVAFRQVHAEDGLASLPAGRSREIDVLEFVPSDQVDPILFDRSYFLEPDKNAVRACDDPDDWERNWRKYQLAGIQAVRER